MDYRTIDDLLLLLSDKLRRNKKVPDPILSVGYLDRMDRPLLSGLLSMKTVLVSSADCLIFNFYKFGSQYRNMLIESKVVVRSDGALDAA